MRIFLLGYMGSGKSTIGDALAARLQLPFIDLDKRIEAHEGSNVSEIFERNGEHYFRSIESAVLEELIRTEASAVIATGGGTPCFNSNLDLMHVNGVTVYLKCRIETLMQRLQGTAETRPLLQAAGFSPENHLKARESVYQQAQHVIANDGEINAAVDAIMRILATPETSA